MTVLTPKHRLVSLIAEIEQLEEEILDQKGVEELSLFEQTVLSGYRHRKATLYQECDELGITDDQRYQLLNDVQNHFGNDLGQKLAA